MKKYSLLLIGVMVLFLSCAEEENVGWVRIVNNTPETTFEFPKYGDTYFMWDANGKHLSTDDAAYLLFGEEQYCKVTSSKSEYVRFQIGLKKYRLKNKTNSYVGSTVTPPINFLGSLSNVVEE
jgi:hypothetical protein